MRVPSLQLCPILCDPMDCSQPGFSVHGILQARILKWVAMPSSREKRFRFFLSYIINHSRFLKTVALCCFIIAATESPLFSDTEIYGRDKPHYFHLYLINVDTMRLYNS